MQKIDHYNPDVLKWARKRSGKINTKEFQELKPKILKWENKERFSTYVQLERLADIQSPNSCFFLSGASRHRDGKARI